MSQCQSLSPFCCLQKLRSGFPQSPSRHLGCLGRRPESLVRRPGCKEWAEVQLVIVSLIREKSLLGFWVEQESKPGLPLPLVS